MPDNEAVGVDSAMYFDNDFLVRLAQAAAVGIAVAVVLRVFGRFTIVRRAQTSVLLATVAAALYLLVAGLNVPDDSIWLKVIQAAGILMVANAGVQVFDVVVWDYLLRQRQRIVLPRLVVDVFNFAVLVSVGLIVISIIFNVDLSAFLITSTVLSAVIGLSLQDTLGNVFAGLALQLEHPFNVGDWVKVGGEEGQVVQMNWRTLVIRTRDNHNVFLPNGIIARQDIINYSRPTPLQRMHISVGAAYAHPPADVKRALIAAAVEAPGVSKSPPPEAIIKGYGDFAVQYDLRYWIDDYAAAQQIQDAVLTRIWYGLRRHEMTIPFPIRDVNLRAIPEDAAERRRADNQKLAFGTLRTVPLFSVLNDAQLHKLAAAAALLRFTDGEALVRQGDTGDSLFVVQSGAVSVRVSQPDAPSAEVATLAELDFFGEMSLLTGARRSASVVAVGDVQVLKVDKAALAPLLAADETLAKALSKTLTSRMQAIARREAADSANAPAKQLPPATVLNHIRSFFGLK